MRRDNKVKVIIIQGIFSVIVACITGFFSYKAGENAVITEVNSKVSQEVNIDNGDFAAIINELFDENKKLQDSLQKLNEENNTTNDNKEINSNVMLEKIESKHLDELKIVDSRFYNTINNFTDSYGSNYNMSYELAGSCINANAFVVYSLQGQYEEFSASIVTGDKTNSDINVNLYIYIDDKLIDTITGIKKQTERIDIGPYNIIEARKLTIEEVADEGLYAYVYLVDAYVK